MNITAVRVRRLVSGPGYNHTAVEAESSVPNGADPEEIRIALSAWCDMQIAAEKDAARMLTSRRALIEEVGQLENQRDELRKTVDATRKIVKEHEDLRSLAMARNIDVAGFTDDLPF